MARILKNYKTGHSQPKTSIAVSGELCLAANAISGTIPTCAVLNIKLAIAHSRSAPKGVTC